MKNLTIEQIHHDYRLKVARMKFLAKQNQGKTEQLEKRVHVLECRVQQLQRLLQSSVPETPNNNGQSKVGQRAMYAMATLIPDYMPEI